MSVAAARPSAANPDVSDLLARARAIGALARERAQQTESDRRVGDDMIERMRQADLFRVMQPRSYGGLEHGFDVFAQIVAAIASGCGSTGWVYALLASHQWLIACFSKAAQDEVWQERTALAAGTYAPVGQAMAEGALADFLAMASVRTTRGAVAGGNRRMAELTTVQMRVAEASACIDAARLLMFRDLAEAFETAARGDPISVDVRLRNRRDQAFCVRLLVAAIDALFLAAGGQGLFLSQPLQRAWRDAHAAASHISLNWDSTGSMYGQFMLGLEPKGQY